MSANPAFKYPAIIVGDRVVVIDGSTSDYPNYEGATGTVVGVFPESVDVELDHYGYSTVFPSSHLEVTP